MDARGSDPEETGQRSWSRRLTEPPDHLPIPPPPVRAPADKRQRQSEQWQCCSAPADPEDRVRRLFDRPRHHRGRRGHRPGHHGGNAWRPGAAGGQSVPLPGASQVPGAGVAPAVFVVSSATATLHQHSADVTISGSVSADGQSVPIDGTGYADFDQDAFSANLTMNSPTGALGEDEIAVGGHIYLSVGRGWCQHLADHRWPALGRRPGARTGLQPTRYRQCRPAGAVQVLEQQGATVTPLGTSTMEGETVSGYSVTPSQAEEQQAIQQEVQSGQIPQSAVPMVEQEMQAIGTPTMGVYFDASKLLRKLSVTFGGGSSPVTASVEMTFDDYGTTVSIGPPASSDVISYAQFLEDLQAARHRAPSPTGGHGATARERDPGDHPGRHLVAPTAICRCAPGGHTPASSTAGADPPPAPPGSAECGAPGSSPAWRPRPSR